MKLPNADLAVVEREKITDYLLNEAHRYGASKARFFVSFGFHLSDWNALAQALRTHGQRHEVATVRETGFGPRYEVRGSVGNTRRPQTAPANRLATRRWASCPSADHRVPFGGDR